MDEVTFPETLLFNTGAISVKKELDYVKYTAVVQYMNIGAKFASGY